MQTFAEVPAASSAAYRTLGIRRIANIKHEHHLPWAGAATRSCPLSLAVGIRGQKGLESLDGYVKPP